MAESEHHATWFHGSPFHLTMLYPGNTVTPDRHLATVFSHRPTIVSIEDDGQIKHNGSIEGFLYWISEPLQPGDLIPHPHSTMPGREWVAQRALQLTLIGETEIIDDEMLTIIEIEELQKRAKAA